jgi:hypothetical protein
MSPNSNPVVSTTKDIVSTPPKDESNLVSRMAAANELANDSEAVKEAFKYGRVPVSYLPTCAMMRPGQTPGLLEFIRKAKTVKEVENLLKRSVKFETAHPGTIRKWEKAAAIRTLELKRMENLNPRKGHTPLETLVKPVKKARKTTKSKKA